MGVENFFGIGERVVEFGMDNGEVFRYFFVVDEVVFFLVVLFDLFV